MLPQPKLTGIQGGFTGQNIADKISTAFTSSAITAPSSLQIQYNAAYCVPDNDWTGPGADFYASPDSVTTIQSSSISIGAKLGAFNIGGTAYLKVEYKIVDRYFPDHVDKVKGDSCTVQAKVSYVYTLHVEFSGDIFGNGASPPPIDIPKTFQAQDAQGTVTQQDSKTPH